MSDTRQRKRDPSDLTDAQWERIEACVPPVSPHTTMPTMERREIVNAILDVRRTGCSWRHRPHDVPHGKTAHHSVRIWSHQGVWEPIMAHGRKRVRETSGRDPEPRAASIASPSLTTAPVRGSEKGDDAGKNNRRTQAARAR